MKLFREARTLLSVGLIWGMLWAAVAIVGGSIIGKIDPSQFDPGEEPIVLAPAIGSAGFICGAVFGVLLLAWEKRPALFDRLLVRSVILGVLVSAALPLVAGKGIPEMFVTISLGAVSAILSVPILRKWRHTALRVEARPA